MTTEELAKRIFDLDIFDLYDAYDNSETGTIEEVLKGLKNSIENDPQGVITFLIESIEDLTA